jgi:hypothetical protein
MRHRILAIIAASISGALALLTAEILVRYLAPVPVFKPIHGPTALHEPDPELGWRNKEGRSVWPGRGIDTGRDIVLTFWEDGLRATAARRQPGRPQIVLVGCSITQSWAVTDEETWAWRLQAAFPDFEILNLGTGGYGTYQSLLALERYLARAPTNPVLVVYGFIEYHEGRNVAPADWLRSVRRTSDAGPVRVPFATLGPDGTLVRNEPEAYPHWPFEGVLASVRLLEDRYITFRTRARATQGRAVTDALIAEMAGLSRAHGVPLLLVVLHATTAERRDHYDRLSASLGVASVDCILPDLDRPSHKVPIYGHPSGVANAEWAECIGAKLRSMGFE